MDTVSALRAARAKIEAGWCRRAIARTKAGRRTTPENGKAAFFCAIGAIYAAVPGDISQWCAQDALRAALPEPFTKVDEFNDAPKTRKADVLALYDRAIATAGSHDDHD